MIVEIHDLADLHGFLKMIDENYRFSFNLT